MLRNTKDEIDSTNDKGTFDFGTTSSAFDTNYAPANMLTGALSSFTQIEKVAHKDSLYCDYHFFIQDTWKATRNLTVDFGLRAYHVPAQTQRNPKDTLDAVFLPSRWDPKKAPRYYVPDPKNTKLIIDPAFPDNPLPSAVANVLRFTVVPGSGDLLNGVYAYGTPEAGKSGLLDPKFLLLAALR